MSSNVDTDFIVSPRFSAQVAATQLAAAWDGLADIELEARISKDGSNHTAVGC
jgi:hypothetical protein